MLTTIVAVVGGLVAGAIVALKVIAPRTKTTKDDEALAFLQKVSGYLPPVEQAEAAKLLKR